MQGSARRKVEARNGVGAGSVWERRMRMDEVKGGIKVFNGDKGRKDDGNADEDGLRAYPKLRRNQSDSVSMERRKRRSWRPPELRKVKSDLSNSPRMSNGHCGEIGEEKDVSGGSGNGGGDGEKEVLLIGDGCEEGGNEEEEVCEIEEEEEKKNFDDKEMDMAVEKAKSEEVEERINEILVEKPKNVEEEEKMMNKIHEISVLHKVEKKPMPPVNRRAIHAEAIKATPAIEVEEEILVSTSGATQNKMQNIG